MLQFTVTISARAIVFVLLLASVALSRDTVRAAPSSMNLTADQEIKFTTPGFNAAHDINVVDQAGALRFYACPQLTNPPNCAAIQFYGNDANVFGGQMFLDSGATENGAIILRTASNGQGLAERMRVTSNGNVGIGTTTPRSALHVATNYIQFPVKIGGNSGAPIAESPPVADCDELAEVGRVIVNTGTQLNGLASVFWICASRGTFTLPPTSFGWLSK